MDRNLERILEELNSEFIGEFIDDSLIYKISLRLKSKLSECNMNLEYNHVYLDPLSYTILLRKDKNIDTDLEYLGEII